MKEAALNIARNDSETESEKCMIGRYGVFAYVAKIEIESCGPKANSFTNLFPHNTIIFRPLGQALNKYGLS